MAKITQTSNGDTGLTARTNFNEAMKTVEVDVSLTGDGTVGNELGVDLLDEDDMASNSATKAATQQSIKAYVDNTIAGIIITSIDNTDSPYTVLSTDELISCDTSSGAITINVGAAASFTAFPYIHNTTLGANNVTIDPNGAETIATAATLTLTPGESVRIYSDGTNLEYV